MSSSEFHTHFQEAQNCCEIKRGLLDSSWLTEIAEIAHSTATGNQ